MNNLTESRRRVIQKYLYHYARQFTVIGHHTIYAASWNVRHMPAPPEELPLRPPPNWAFPDVLVFCLYNVSVDLESAWIDICDYTMSQYDTELVPLSPVHPFHHGSLILAYIRRRIGTSMLHGVAVGEASTDCAAASSLRFCLHQMEIAIVCLNPDRHNQDFEKDEHYCGQLFHQVTSSMEFDAGGRVHGLDSHPCIIFGGTKDYNPTNRPVTFTDTIDRLPTLDIRYTSAPNKGFIEILKAGKITLLLEDQKDAGVRMESPEVVLMKVGVPSVDKKKLQTLYKELLRGELSRAEDQRLPFDIEPNTIQLEKPIKPFRPVKMKVQLKNPDCVPSAYTVLSLSGNHRVVPISRHSILHTERYGTSNAPMLIKTGDIPHETKRKGGIQKKVRQLMRATDGQVGWLTTRLVGGGKKKGEDPESARDTGRSRNDSGAREVTTVAQEGGGCSSNDSEIAWDAPTMAAGDVDSIEGMQTPKTTPKSGARLVPPVELWKARNHEDKADCLNEHYRGNDIDLSKWISVDPPGGLVQSANSITLDVTIHLQEACTRDQEVPGTLLAMRQDETGFDRFFCVVGKIERTIIGMSLIQLHSFQTRCLRPRPSGENIGFEGKILIKSKRTGKPKGLRDTMTGTTQPLTVQELQLLQDAAETDQAMPAVDACDKPLPMPKEIWWLLSYIHDNIEDTSFLLPSLKHEDDASVVMDALETGVSIPPSVNPIGAIRVLEQVLHNLPSGILPSEFLTQIDGEHAHALCRAALLSLPIINRNILICLFGLVRKWWLQSGKTPARLEALLLWLGSLCTPHPRGPQFMKHFVMH